MAKSLVKENTFDGAPGGGSGTLNYQTGYGTSGGGNVSQNPSKFTSSEKTVDHFNNNVSTGSTLSPQPERIKDLANKPASHVGGNMGKDQKKSTGEEYGGGIFPKNDRESSSGGTISPAAMADKAASLKPMNPDQIYEPQVNQLFKKKVTPSPDEILSAMQYEMGNMVKKDKHIAKQIVLKNLRADPQYYSRLGMLNIDDKKMKVDESKDSTFQKTKNLLDQMIFEKKKKIGVADPNLDEILNGLWQKRHGYRAK